MKPYLFGIVLFMLVSFNLLVDKKAAAISTITCPYKLELIEGEWYNAFRYVDFKSQAETINSLKKRNTVLSSNFIVKENQYQRITIYNNYYVALNMQNKEHFSHVQSGIEKAGCQMTYHVKTVRKIRGINIIIGLRTKKI